MVIVQMMMVFYKLFMVNEKNSYVMYFAAHCTLGVKSDLSSQCTRR